MDHLALSEELGIFAALVADTAASIPSEYPARAAGITRLAASSRRLAERLGHLHQGCTTRALDHLLLAIHLLEREVCGVCLLEEPAPRWCPLGRGACRMGRRLPRGKPLPLV